MFHLLLILPLMVHRKDVARDKVSLVEHKGNTNSYRDVLQLFYFVLYATARRVRSQNSK